MAKIVGISARRPLLFAAGILICLYAVWVLSYVRLIPDVGIRCAFTTQVNQIFPNYLVDQPDGLDPGRGDQVVRIGGLPVFIWPQILRTLVDVTKQPAPVVSDLSTADAKGWQYVQLGSEKLVRLQFLRHDNDGKEIEFSRWFRLGRPPSDELIPSALWFCLKIGLFAVGALVFWKRPNDRAAAQFFLLCIVTVGAYMGGYHWARIATEPVLLVVFMICAVLLPAVCLHFYLLFPSPKPLLERYPTRALAAVYGLPAASLLLLLVQYGRLRGLIVGGHLNSQDLLENVWGMLRLEISFYLGIAALWYLLSIACLAYSFRTARDITERNQVKWILFGSLAALVPIGYTLYLIFWQRDAFSAGRATWPMFAASVCFTAAFAISITRYRLLQLDQIVSSGAVYVFISILAAVVAYAVAFAAMLAATLVGTQYIPPSIGQAVWVSATAVILFIILNQARSRFKKAVDRHFDRQKLQLDKTLKRMGEAIEQLVDPPTLGRRLLQTSAELLNVSQGAVYLREGDPALYRLAGCLGSTTPMLNELPPGCPLVESLNTDKVVYAWPYDSLEAAQRQLRFMGGEVAFALCHESRLMAFLILGAKAVGSYRRDDLNLLGAFTQFTALALESAQRHHTIEVLNQELKIKVQKISEQQRRILALQNQLMKAPLARLKETDAKPPERAVKAEPGSPDATGASPDAFRHIIGAGATLRPVVEMARKVAATPSSVLIHGESGTGKELLAHALHESSARAGKPYVTVHCAALSPTLLESELFGHVKGAFTGAHRDKMGRFEMANGGTLFLDEIGDISWDVQTKLLRVIQEKTFERVGSSEPVRVDVRIIAATHRNLDDLIRANKFREDLYYRLNVISMRMPPLRERREDIPELVLHFLRLYGEQAGKTMLAADDDALSLLRAHRWPGNVRELQNVIERAVAVSEGSLITAADLPMELRRGTDSMDGQSDYWQDLEPIALSIPGGTIRAERDHRNRRDREQLIRALAAANGNKAEAARALGMARSTLISRLKKFGLG
jgi:transcriptional regulator with GAF, ATPase, and Fis domain